MYHPTDEIEVGPFDMLDAVSVDDASDSVPVEETSQNKGANGKEF